MAIGKWRQVFERTFWGGGDAQPGEIAHSLKAEILGGQPGPKGGRDGRAYEAIVETPRRPR
jgi:hypothetical protein